jgi:hypothetical protein
MMIKLSLFVAITLLLCASHFMAVVLGSAVVEKEQHKGPDHAKWKAKIAWLLGFAVLPWSVAMLLIAVVAA